jgi:hypothetical protein
MPIKQADDHLMGYGSGDSGRGDDLAEGVAHGVKKSKVTQGPRSWPHQVD